MKRVQIGRGQQVFGGDAAVGLPPGAAAGRLRQVLGVSPLADEPLAADHLGLQLPPRDRQGGRHCSPFSEFAQEGVRKRVRGE